MKRKDFGMMQKETLQFFGAFRRFGRANKNMNKQPVVVCGIDMEELKADGLERPGMAELLVYSMLVAHRHKTTNVCWLSKRGAADKLSLSPSTVHEAYKWLEKAKLIYLHDDNRLVRQMIKNGKGHQVNLYTVFDLPGYRWASTVRVTTSKQLAAKFEREEQDNNEGFHDALHDVLMEAEDAGVIEPGIDHGDDQATDGQSVEPLFEVSKKMVSDEFETFLEAQPEPTLLDRFIVRELEAKATIANEEKQYQKNLEDMGQLRLLGGKDGQ